MIIWPSGLGLSVCIWVIASVNHLLTHPHFLSHANPQYYGKGDWGWTAGHNGQCINGYLKCTQTSFSSFTRSTLSICHVSTNQSVQRSNWQLGEKMNNCCKWSARPLLGALHSPLGHRQIGPASWLPFVILSFSVHTHWLMALRGQIKTLFRQ